MNIKRKQYTQNHYLITIDLPFNGYENIYQAMCVNHDVIDKENIQIYNDEELSLEVV